VPACPPAPAAAGSARNTYGNSVSCPHTSSYGDKAVGALGDGLLSECIVDDVVQNDAAAGVRGGVNVLARAERRDVERHAVPAGAQAASQSHVTDSRRLTTAVAGALT
jgi:hypothetical protein